MVAYINIIKGIKKISLNEIKMKEDLENSWEIIAEPIQMIARKYNIPNSYELLKDASRGKKITKTELHNIISKLNIPEHEKINYLLTPTKYIDLSSKLCNGNREYLLLSKIEDILIAKNYEFQTLNNIIKVYFNSGDEIEIIINNTIILNKYTNGVTKQFIYESENDFLKNIERL